MTRISTLFMVIIFCLALIPRVVGVQPFITSDEEKWVARSEQFLAAIHSGDYARTNQTGHPGVTTMWLGASGIILAKTLVTHGWFPPEYLSQDYLLLHLIRIPLGIVHALGIALAYLFIRTLFDTHIAVVATGFWAMNPFVIAHAQLLHNDALLTTFMSLALLAALVTFRPGEQIGQLRWGALVVSGVAAGLAFLTKSPSAMVLPAVGVLGLVAMRQQRRHVVVGLLVWGLMALGVWVALWPAAWGDMAGSVNTVVREVLKNGAMPHSNGNFFLGQPVADPGWLFYPVVLVFRLTPWALIGMGASVVIGYSFWRHPHDQRPAGWWQTVVLLWCFVLLFLIPMSMLSKKFDRYILPVFPLLDLLAAIGFVGAWRLWQPSYPTRRGVKWGVVSVGALVVIGTGAWYHPYELAYYNPLAGGSKVAAQVLLIGRGEGLEEVGAYIAHQDAIATQRGDDSCSRPIVALNVSGLLEDFVCGTVLNELVVTRYPPRLRYIVLYINQVQRNPAIMETLRQLWGDIEPVYTVTKHSIPYAHVYAPPLAQFGNEHNGLVAVRDYRIDTAAVREQEQITVTLRLRAETALEQHAVAELQIIDARGQPIAEEHIPLGTPNQWQMGTEREVMRTLPIPRAYPAGVYTPTLRVVAVAANKPLAQEQLPLLVGAGRTDVMQDGESGTWGDRLLLEPITLPFAISFGDHLHLSNLAIETVDTVDTVNTVGTTAQPDGIPTKQVLHLFVEWQKETVTDDDASYMLFIRVFDGKKALIAQGDVSLAAPDAPVPLWAVGEPMGYTHSIPLPAHDASDGYWVAMGVYRLDDWSRLPIRGATQPVGAPDVGEHALIVRVEPR